MVKPFDWSYSTDYKGTLAADAPAFTPTETPIPLELLKRPDPILFFDEVVLYEDEMADNGITMLSCKIRVMPDRLLLLSRFFMRLDNVLFRLRDTRVFIEFRTGDVTREYVAKAENYEKVRMVSLGNSEYYFGYPLTRAVEAIDQSTRCARPDAKSEQHSRSSARGQQNAGACEAWLSGCDRNLMPVRSTINEYSEARRWRKTVNIARVKA